VPLRGEASLPKNELLNMSLERSEFEFRVHTPLELAGAEKGACELERAIGKARALGRKSAHLERQLARVRRGVRHFRLTHPGVGEPDEERTEAAKEDGNEPSLAAEDKEIQRRAETRSQDATRREGGEWAGEDDSYGMENNGVTPPARPETDALSGEAQANGTCGVTDDSSNSPEPDSAGPPAAEPGVAEIPEEGESRPDSAPQSGEAMAETGPGTAAAAAVWNARAQREVEEMVQAAMSKRERERPRVNNGGEERMAALEMRIRRLEEQGKINRDAG
jgi:hypothetical protein